MDFGAFQLGLVEIAGVLVLLVGLIWAVIYVNSGGKKDSPAETERATAELYEKEEQRHDDGTEGR